MSSFFRKIPQSLVVLVLVFAVYTGHAFAVEGDTSASPPIVTLPAPAGSISISTPDTSGPADSSDAPLDSSPDDSDGADWSDGIDYSDFGGYGGHDTFTVSGTDVTVNVEKHDTLSVTSVAPDTSEVSAPFVYCAEPKTPTLAETIRDLFGPYTYRKQTVTTYYDGQVISVDDQIVPGLAGLDYEWLAGVFLFALTIYCLFRLLGGVLRNG